MTRFGVGALVVGVALTLLGFILAWAEVALVGVSVIAAVALAVAYALRRPHLRITRQVQPPRVAKGLPAIAYLEFANVGRGAIGRTVAQQPFGDISVRTILPRLERGQAGMRTYRLPTSRRGVFEVGPVEVSRRDPFELVRLTQRHAGTETIWVYPSIFPLRSLPSGPTRHLEGPSSDTSPQGSITFHRLREYVAGDDLRMIHWKSSARTGRLMVRHNVDTSQPYTVVLLDLRPGPYSAESFELAVDVAASVVTCSSRGKSPVQLRLSSNEQLGGPRSFDAQGLMDHLTTVNPAETPSVTADLLRLRRERGGTALVVVTGVLDDDVLPAAAALRRRFERVVVVSVTVEPTPASAYPGIVVISAHDKDTFVRGWNYGIAR